MPKKTTTAKSGEKIINKGKISLKNYLRTIDKGDPDYWSQHISEDMVDSLEEQLQELYDTADEELVAGWGEGERQYVNFIIPSYQVTDWFFSSDPVDDQRILSIELTVSWGYPSLTSAKGLPSVHPYMTGIAHRTWKKYKKMFTPSPV